LQSFPKIWKENIVRKIVSLLAAAGLLGVMAQSSQAVVVTFAQFREFPAIVQNPQVFNLTNPISGNVGNAGASTLGTNPGAAPDAVVFTFLSLAPTDLLGQNIRAIVTLTATSVGNSQAAVGGGIQQRFANITETFVAQSGNALGQTFGGTTVANGTVLLTLQSRIGAPAGLGDLFQGSGNSGTLSGSDADIGNDVVFNSFYIPGLATHVEDDYGQGFSSITPSLHRVGGGGIGNAGIGSFTAAGVGTFDTEFVVPEPSAVAMLLGMGVSGSAFLMRRRRKK